MRLIYLLLISLFFCSPAFAFQLVGSGVAAGGTCTATDTNTVENDNTSSASEGDGVISQHVSNSSALDICQIDAKVYRFTGDITVKVEIWSDVSMTGTKYAESDSDVSITEVNPAGTLYEWDITTTVQPTSDYYVHFIQTNASYYMRATISYSTSAFGGSTYNQYLDGVEDTARQMTMTVWSK